MKLSEYQNEATATAIYPNRGNNLVYPALGLGGEAGEIQNKIKKVIRDDGGILLPEKRKEIGSEIGDVLWYCATLANECGLSLEDIAQENIRKLKDRQARGVLAGSGDKR